MLTIFSSPGIKGQSIIDSNWIHNDVKITVDRPANADWKKKSTIIIFFALPNGNSTEQTMGKKITAADDWHFDIQHIRAQTAFIRNRMITSNIVVVYLENRLKSWPAWKQRHPDFGDLIPAIVDSISSSFPAKHPSIYLNGHSGGGSFIFGYLASVKAIPRKVKRISFIDSDYGYDSSYYPKLEHWLQKTNGATLTVMAYNDSIALYNGKPLVSATGGTWYRSHLMLKHLEADHHFTTEQTDSLSIYKSTDKRIQFYFKINTDRGIYHTQQVELNGFIHSVLCNSLYDSKDYSYYGKRAYADLIK